MNSYKIEVGKKRFAINHKCPDCGKGYEAPKSKSLSDLMIHFYNSPVHFYPEIDPFWKVPRWYFECTHEGILAREFLVRDYALSKLFSKDQWQGANIPIPLIYR